MKLYKFLISLLLLLFVTTIVVSQNNTTKEKEGSLTSGSIESQFDYLYKKSPKWTDPNTGQRYKTVKVNNLFKFKNNVIDSLKLGRKNLFETQKIVTTQKSEIGALKLELGTTNESLTSVTKEKDSIRFLGIPLSKSGYNTILWSIIAGLAALLAFFIIRFKRSNTITVTANNGKDEIEAEYEDYRQKAIEREQKLRRELQDELNKQKYAKQDASKKKR